VRLIGHAAIRSRGTVGGSVAHADPAAELPAVLLALGARFVARSASQGERTIAADQMFQGPLTTALAPDELLTEIVVPPLPVGGRTAFVEHARTHGDFAIAGAAVVLVPGEHAAIGLLGADTVPVRATDAERALVEGAPPEEAARRAAAAVQDDYRRALLTEVVRRAIERALS
jgi:CO/xanthine dehydrogenase FAD-binding subunit